MHFVPQYWQVVLRAAELQKLGVNVKIVAIGKKVSTFFKRRPQYNMVKSFDMGSAPTTAEAQASRTPPLTSFWK